MLQKLKSKTSHLLKLMSQCKIFSKSLMNRRPFFIFLNKLIQCCIHPLLSHPCTLVRVMFIVCVNPISSWPCLDLGPLNMFVHYCLCNLCTESLVIREVKKRSQLMIYDCGLIHVRFSNTQFHQYTMWQHNTNSFISNHTHNALVQTYLMDRKMFFLANDRYKIKGRTVLLEK